MLLDSPPDFRKRKEVNVNTKKMKDSPAFKLVEQKFPWLKGDDELILGILSGLKEFSETVFEAGRHRGLVESGKWWGQEDEYPCKEDYINPWFDANYKPS